MFLEILKHDFDEDTRGRRSLILGEMDNRKAMPANGI
jgi:hypothetical protein